MAGFKYVVIKNNVTVARTTTLKEAKAEAKRVGGHYEPLSILRNPVDPDYTKRLGAGAFSGAYKREFDPGVRGVQNTTKLEHVGGAIDAAKILLVEARKLLKGNRKAQKYLPNIRPIRVDYTDPQRPEFIYAQPLLNPPWGNHRPQNAPWINEIANAIDRSNTGTDTLNVSAERVVNKLRNAQHKQARDEAKAIQDALLAIHDVAERYKGPYKMHRYWSDMHSGNYATDRKDQHLVIFDPFVYTLSIDNALKLWKDLGFPNATPKAVRKAKVPKGPKTAKVPRAKGKRAVPKKVPATLAPEFKSKFRNKKDLLLFYIGYAEGDKLWPDMTLEMADMFGNAKSDRLFAASFKVPQWLQSRVGNVSSQIRLLAPGALLRDPASGSYTLTIKPKVLREALLAAKRLYPSR
jgi:hypothetical protein